MSSSCDYYEALILRLPDGDFTDVEADALREHLRSCPSCRRLFRALEAAERELEENQAQPPAALAEGVMERIAARRTESARRQTPRRRWRGAAIAACLLIVVGGGAYLALDRLGRAGSANPMEAVMEAPMMMEAVSEDAPMAEDAAAGDAAAAPVPAPESEYAPEDPLAAAEAVAFEQADAAEDSPWPATSWMEPAQVPPDREADFEAIVTDSRRDASMTTSTWDVIAYVEYRGVIYEFLTNDGETLLWRDAAEGLFPCVSPLTADKLLEIIG